MAAVDGNTIRILSRYFGILDYPDTALLKKYMEYAQNCLVIPTLPTLIRVWWI